MQQERERWQTENASLRSELEQLKRGGMVRSPHPPSMVTTPPGGQQIRTPSPESEDANLERLMIKVERGEGWRGRLTLSVFVFRLLKIQSFFAPLWYHLKR